MCRPFPLRVSKRKTREPGMAYLIAADQLVTEAQSREDAPLLQPEDRAEAPAEKDACGMLADASIPPIVSVPSTAANATSR